MVADRPSRWRLVVWRQHDSASVVGRTSVESPAIGYSPLTGRRTGEHTRIDRPAAGGVDVFRDRELSLYEERTTLYERADSDGVDTTFAADDDEKDDDQTRQEEVWQEFDDALNVDLGVEDDQEERATWEAVGDLVDNAPTSTDNATYYL